MVLSVRTPPSVQIGQLNRRAELLAKSMAPAGGAAGTGMDETFTRVAYAWVSIRSLRGGRYIAGKQTEEVATHQIAMRHRDDLGAWDHIRLGSRTLRVVSKADPDGARRWLEVLAEELTP